MGQQSTHMNHHIYILNMIGLIQDYNEKIDLPIQCKKFKILEDGYRYTGYGNAGGGSWEGDYRYFLIETTSGENQIVSFSILGNFYSMDSQDYKKFSNLNKHTCLIVAIDDFDKKHNSLQLDLDNDNFVLQNQNSILIRHDGTLTLGRSGRVKRSKVVEYIKSRAPHLVQGNWVILGSLPCDRLINWNDAQEFMFNCIEYALLRDDFRRTPV